MFSITLKRSLVSLTVTAGLLAAAGPAAASPAASPSRPAQASGARTSAKLKSVNALPRGRAPLSLNLQECMVSG